MQFADLQKLYARYREETEEALLRAAASGRYIGGEEVEAFARELGEWTWCPWPTGRMRCRWP